MFLPRLTVAPQPPAPGDDDVVGTFATVIGGRARHVVRPNARPLLAAGTNAVRRRRSSRQGGRDSRARRRAASARRHRRRPRAPRRGCARGPTRAGSSSSAIFLHAKSGRVAGARRGVPAMARGRTTASISCWCAAITTPMPATRRPEWRRRAASASRIRSAPFLACHAPARAVPPATRCADTSIPASASQDGAKKARVCLLRSRTAPRHLASVRTA